MTGKDVLPEKRFARTFEYLSLGKELKAQTDITKKQHQQLDNTHEIDKIIKKEKSNIKKIY